MDWCLRLHLTFYSQLTKFIIWPVQRLLRTTCTIQSRPSRLAHLGPSICLVRLAVLITLQWNLPIFCVLLSSHFYLVIVTMSFDLSFGPGSISLSMLGQCGCYKVDSTQSGGSCDWRYRIWVKMTCDPMKKKVS